jgi:hypothetical protein
MSVTYSDSVACRKSFAALPLATHKAEETVPAAGSKRQMIDKTVEKMDGLQSTSGASLIYAGYPYDPYA